MLPAYSDINLDAKFMARCAILMAFSLLGSCTLQFLQRNFVCPYAESTASTLCVLLNNNELVDEYSISDRVFMVVARGSKLVFSFLDLLAPQKANGCESCFLCSRLHTGSNACAMNWCRLS